MILFFDLDDEIEKNALNKINKIYQKIDFDILFFYKMDYVWNKSNTKEINYIDVDDIYKKQINIENILKNNWYKLNNNKVNYFLLFKLAQTAGPIAKIYSSKMLFQMNKELDLNNNFFYDKALYKNFDFKLSYLSVFYSKNIVLVNDKYYKYYVGSESSVTKNDIRFQKHLIYSNLIKFLKLNIKTQAKNSNNKRVFWISFLLFYSITENNIKIIDLIKLKRYLFYLTKKINKDEEFKKILPVKQITILFIFKKVFIKINNIVICFYKKLKKSIINFFNKLKK